MLLSSEILVGIETGGGARFGHALKISGTDCHHDDLQCMSPVNQKPPENCGKAHLILSWNRDRKRVEMLSRGFRKCFSSGGCRFFGSVSNFSERSQMHQLSYRHIRLKGPILCKTFPVFLNNKTFLRSVSELPRNGKSFFLLAPHFRKCLVKPSFENWPLVMSQGQGDENGHTMGPLNMCKLTRMISVWYHR